MGSGDRRPNVSWTCHMKGGAHLSLLVAAYEIMYCMSSKNACQVEMSYYFKP